MISELCEGRRALWWIRKDFKKYFEAFEFYGQTFELVWTLGKNLKSFKKTLMFSLISWFLCSQFSMMRGKIRAWEGGGGGGEGRPPWPPLPPLLTSGAQHVEGFYFRRPARGGILLPGAAVHTLCEYEDKLGCIFSSNVTLRAEILEGGGRDITSIFLHIWRKVVLIFLKIALK
jgi:hypothetical protein